MGLMTLNIAQKGDKEEVIWMQVTAIIVSCLSAITYGLLLAWTSPFVVKITSDKINYDVTSDQASMFTYIPQLAMLVFCATFSKLSDVMGRKRTLMLITIPHCISWICTIVSRNIYVLYASRVFSGMADGCLLATLPVYIGEISVPKVRGTWGNLIAVFTFLGIFLINVIGTQCSVQVAAYICIPLPIIFLTCMYFLPESPYWYIIKGKNEEAKQSLRVLRRLQDVDNIFKKLKEDIDIQMKERGSWKDLFTVNANRRALIAGVFLRVAQLFGGVGVFMSFTQYIFQHLKVDIASEIPTIIFSGVCLVLLFVSGYVIERIGKKKCFIVTNFLSGIVLLVVTVYFYIDDEIDDIDVSSLKWFPIMGMILYAILVSFGNIPIPNIMLGELFSTSIKSKGISVLTVTYGLTYFLTNFIFYFLNTRVGMYGPFLFFGLSSLLSTILAFPLLPETAGKTLEEIQMILK